MCFDFSARRYANAQQPGDEEDAGTRGHGEYFWILRVSYSPRHRVSFQCPMPHAQILAIRLEIGHKLGILRSDTLF
jgi:hypothetical protein